MAVLGIQRAGAAYLPLDTGQPDARIATILADAGVRVVVGRSDAAPLPEGIRLVAADLLAEAGEDELPPQVDIAPDDLAYIIYTSGSTGTPKGVMISHRAAMNTILDVNRRYGVDAGDRILALARLSFDLSVYDIFGLLAAGGAVVIPDEEESLQPQAWVRLLHEHRVSLWNSVPALGQLLADAAAEGEGQPLPLRLAIFSGDWIPQSLPPRLKQLVPGIRVMAMAAPPRPPSGPTSTRRARTMPAGPPCLTEDRWPTRPSPSLMTVSSRVPTGSPGTFTSAETAWPSVTGTIPKRRPEPSCRPGTGIPVSTARETRHAITPTAPSNSSAARTSR